MTSREEYLKRYMSGADGQKKKKKRKGTLSNATDCAGDM
jgi:hypothetical protein